MTATVKHTAGSWMTDYEAGGQWGIHADMGPRGWKYITTVAANGLGALSVGVEESEANARLIAAAPILLVSLEEMRANLLAHARLGLSESEVAMLRRADAAIRKAKGE